MKFEFELTPAAIVKAAKDSHHQIGHLKEIAMTVAVYVFTVLSFAAVVIFAVKYISQAITGRAQIASDEAYRKLASDAVTAQSGNAATLSAIQSELAEIKTRIGVGRNDPEAGSSDGCDNDDANTRPARQ